MMEIINVCLRLGVQIHLVTITCRPLPIYLFIYLYHIVCFFARYGQADPGLRYPHIPRV